ncbi:MAG: hypothetical protein QM729_19395 [Solirubrobacterales bacterium]
MQHHMGGAGEDDGEDEGDPVDRGHGDPGGAQRGACVGRRERLGVAAEDQDEEVLGDDREPERGQQRRLHPFVDQRVQQHPLDRVADHEHRRGDDQHPHERVDPGVVEEYVGEVGAEDDQLAVDEVDQAHHPEDQREAERGDGEEPAEQQSADGRGDQFMSVRDAERRDHG